MPNLSRLGRGATNKINKAIDELFDNAKARLLGPQSIQGKKIYIGYHRELSLPGIFEAGSVEEAVKPDLEVLESLIRVAGAYVDAHRERTKARVVHEINGAMAEARHAGGMDRGDFRDLVNTKMSEVWADVTNNIHRVVDTEIAHAKNVSVLDGIVGANLNASVGDPVVYFVVVRDNILCKECKRLHLMDDGITPRLWYLSELGHGYHKKGDDAPKIGGLHPHCRCTIVTLLPSYGFTKDGMVKYVKRGHLELPVQRGLALSERDYTSLAKSWDPGEHPRDEQGQFIATDPREEWPEDPAEAAQLQADLDAEEIQQTPAQALDHSLRFLKEMIQEGMMENSPAEIEKILRDQGVWPEDEAMQRRIFMRLGTFAKAQAPKPDLGEIARRIRAQAFNGWRLDGMIPRGEPIKPPPSLTYLFRRQKLYPHDPHSNALRYLIHRIENVGRYDDAEDGQRADKEFADSLDLSHALRSRQGHTPPPIERLRNFAAQNAPLVDGILQNQAALHSILQPHAFQLPDDPEPRVVLVRGLGDGARIRDPLLASYADTTEQTVGGRVKNLHYHAVPVKNVWYSYDHGPAEAHTHPRRKAEDEFLVSPHDLKPAEPSALKKLVPRKQVVSAATPERMASSEMRFAKGLRGLVAGAALGIASMAPNVTIGHGWDDQQRMVDTVPGSPFVGDPDALHPHLHTISHLESSGGKFLDHAPSGHGTYWDAHGELGIKPAAAHDEWKRTPALQKRFPGLQDKKVFTDNFRTSKVLYNASANAMYGRYLHRFKEPARAAYAWRFGEGAALKATPDEYNNHEYVKRFTERLPPSRQKPSLPKKARLGKAIADIPLGQQVGPGENDDAFGERKKYDYSHLLSDEHKKMGMKLYLHHGNSMGHPKDPPIHDLEASLTYPSAPMYTHESAMTALAQEPGTTRDQLSYLDRSDYDDMTRPYEKLAGHALGFVQNGTLKPHFNQGVKPEYRGMGFGSALYSAIFAHAKNALGAHTVEGGYHTVDASAVHKSLSKRHGMQYKSKHIPLDDAPMIAAGGARHYSPGSTKIATPYKYTLKRELSPNKPKLPRRSSRR